MASDALVAEAQCGKLVTYRGEESDSAYCCSIHTLISEHLSQTELPRGTGFDQQLLRDLRTNQTDMKEEPILA